MVGEGGDSGATAPPTPPVPTALENSGKAKHYLRSRDLKKNPGMIYESARAKLHQRSLACGACTGYSFCDRLRNFLRKFTLIVLFSS